MIQSDSDAVAGKKIPTWVFCLPPLIVSLLWWGAFFPALMNADSLYMWGTAVMGRFDEQHTGFLPIVFSLVARVWGNPAAIGLLQILLLMLVLNFLFRTLRSIKTPDWALALISLYFCVSPMISATLITLEKDIPFGILMLLLCVFGIRIIESKGQWLGSIRNLAGLSVSLALMALSRHEGYVPATAFIVALGIFYFREWRRIGAAVAVGSLCVFLVKGPIYDCYHVDRTSYQQVAIKEWCDLAVIRAKNGKLSDADSSFLNGIMSPEPLKPPFDFYRPFISMYVDKVNFPKLYEEHLKVHLIWKRAMAVNWPILFRNLPKSGSIVWEIFEPPGGYTYAVHLCPVPQGIDDNSLGLHLTHPLPAFEGVIRRVLEITQTAMGKAVLYRPAIYLYASIFSVLAACFLKRKPELLLLISAISAHTLLMFLFIQDQHSRYLFYVFLTAPALVAYSWMIVRNSCKNAE